MTKESRRFQKNWCEGKSYPSVLLRSQLTDGDQMQSHDGTKWVPARPMSGMGRWRAAWLVFTGQADALLWEAD